MWVSIMGHEVFSHKMGFLMIRELRWSHESVVCDWSKLPLIYGDDHILVRVRVISVHNNNAIK